MKKIKILISLALCVLMLCTITVPAFAEEEPGVSREDIMFAEYAEVGKDTYFDTGYNKDKFTTVLMDVNVKSSFVGNKKKRNSHSPMVKQQREKRNNCKYFKAYQSKKICALICLFLRYKKLLAICF